MKYTKPRPPWVKDRRVALWGGIAALTVGAVLLYDAYDNRGIKRPLLMKLAPTP